MSQSIRHRGPDDSGHWIGAEDGLGLAFRRLAILDLSELGHQPMVSASGRFIIIFNGEIYNHVELRAELERAGAVFRGRSDTEVILAAFERWGIPASLRRFAGMFAIALWDRERRELTLTRDRLGIKPLFVYWKEGLLSFGSEMKALLAGPAFDAAIDPIGLTDYFRYLFIPSPRTIFRHVSKLPPGHLLTIASAAVAPPPSQSYWDLREVVGARRGALEAVDETEILDRWDALLTTSVREHLESDVPLGALLSGGIDSSSVVALMQQAVSSPVRTFTISFEHPEHDESRHARAVAELLGTHHTELAISGPDALAIVPSLAEMFDEPLADHSQIPAYIVMKLARSAVTVALTGDGGDELLGGYNRYIFGSRMIPRLAGTPRWARSGLAGTLAMVSPDVADQAGRTLRRLVPGMSGMRLAGRKLGKFAGLLRAESPAAMYQMLVSAWPHPAQLVVGGEERPGVLEEVLGDPDYGTLLDRMMLSDQLTYLPDDQLAKIDRVSMAVSLEARVPLLDHRLVEFAWGLPQRMKVRGRDGKWLLRQSLYRRMPRALVDREKVGFTVPLADWLRGPLRPWVESLLSLENLSRGGLLNPAPIRAKWHALLEGKTDDTNPLWAVLMFTAWYDRWIEGAAA